MKELKLIKTEYKNGFKLTDGEYDEYLIGSKDEENNVVLSGSDYFNRTLFTTSKWREKSAGTLKLEDIEPKLLVHGITSKVFEIVPKKCSFGWRSGILYYESPDTKVKIIVEEILEWDE